MLARSRTRRKTASAATYGIEFSDTLNFIVVVALGKLGKAFWEKSTDGGVQLHTLVTRQLGAEGVDGDVEGTTISLELLADENKEKAKGREITKLRTSCTNDNKQACGNFKYTLMKCDFEYL
jgi:hypothetical protein